MLLNLTVDNTFSQIGVILSLLVSAIIGLIPMVLDKSDYIQNSAVKNLSHKQKLLYIEDIVQTGMFDILISIIDLILIFLSIGTTSKDTNSFLYPLLIFSIYWLFYLFSFNFGVLMICTSNGITMINHTIGSATITPAYPIKGTNVNAITTFPTISNPLDTNGVI
mgnify:CR=1 FL=1